ncbi:MAG: N-6 DNA methylase, partial [Flavobacteriales bacterium]|nr:N-6 DNA methylase [Flavobacteriales bacterium]
CKSAFIIPEGVLNNNGAAYRSIRKKLIDQNILYGIIELPHGVFKPYASVKTHALLLNRKISEQKPGIIFISVENDGYTQSDTRKVVQGSQLPAAFEVLQKYQHGEPITNNDVSYHIVSKEEIIHNRKISLIGRTYKALHYAKDSVFKTVRLTPDLITVFKGLSPTQNTPPGDYPLVVTAKEIRTADHYSFDTKAVCIPIVSSSGHGHSSVHRLHYIEGKFALANIMCGISVKDENIINPRYLYYALLAMKDEIIASLMTGTSNVSLDIEDLYELEIPLPDIDYQKKFVEKQIIKEREKTTLKMRIVEIDGELILNAKETWRTSS